MSVTIDHDAALLAWLGSTDRYLILEGDSAIVARGIPDGSIDAICADPPAGIAFMNLAFDHDRGGKEHWIEWLAGILREGYRVLKPGGHMVLWALPRTSHWTAEAIERAGFEIRDVLVHLQGAGFPKSLSVEKAIGGDDGKAWAGWGTSLKPANERWIRAQKPIVELDDCAIISARLVALEALVCSAIAKRAAQSSKPTRASSKKAKGASVPVSAAIPHEGARPNETETGVVDDSSGATDMSRSESAAPMSSNIVSSWLRTWGAISEQMSTFTIATASSLTTDLITLRSSLSQITPESIIPGASNPSGAPSPASVVGQIFDALQAGCSAIQTSVAVEPVSPSSNQETGSGSLRVVNAPKMVLGSEDWILARKPLGSTVAECVLAHGTGALNIEASRVASNGEHKREYQPTNNDRTVLGEQRGFQPTNAAGRWPSNLVLSHTAWEETHCPCGAVLSFVARFCPECGSAGVEHRRMGCCAVGERRVKGVTGGKLGGEVLGLMNDDGWAPEKMPIARHHDPDGLETVTAWECLASCPCGLSTLAPSGGAPPRCRCGRAMAWACPVARLDEQSGETVSGSRSAGVRTGIGYGSNAQGDGGPAIEGSEGGASRFFNTFAPPDNAEPYFWCAKPSAAETEAGCERLPQHANRGSLNTKNGEGERLDGKATPQRKNFHPTKKSIALMRHLVRLVTPPGGIVLDLFGGSGTTVCAATLEGLRGIAIEMDPEFVAIARARSAFWARLAGTKASTVAKPRPVRERGDDSGQGRLF